jgi:hypothetical protein
MKNMGLKSKVLQDLINFMGEKDGEMLKKHPKITAIKVDTVSAMPKKEMMKDLEEESPEEMPEEDMGEEESSKLESFEKALGFDISEKLSPEELKKLLSMI